MPSLYHASWVFSVDAPTSWHSPAHEVAPIDYFRNGQLYQQHLRSDVATDLRISARRNERAPRSRPQDCLLRLKLPLPTRVPLLYVILGVLLALSVVPMYFYSAQIETMNRDRLKTNEMLLQNTVTRSLADDISQHQETLRMMLSNLASSIQVTTGNDIGAQNIADSRTAGAAGTFRFFVQRHCLRHRPERRCQRHFRWTH